mmetsp:Transcript_17883/g.30017  ORF Transcript_17883/g.30017 Transcript_17883/m.30017 type:complete len:94 (-) Transcript_17883:33-314(-)
MKPSDFHKDPSSKAVNPACRSLDIVLCTTWKGSGLASRNLIHLFTLAMPAGDTGAFNGRRGGTESEDIKLSWIATKSHTENQINTIIMSKKLR